MDKERVAIVTGGGQGIGRAMVKRLIEDGRRVVIAEMDRAHLDDIQVVSKGPGASQGLFKSSPFDKLVRKPIEAQAKASSI